MKAKTLHIADDLELPLEAVTQTFAILAKRGSGKTYTGMVMVEEMLKANLQVVCLDPIGVHWGLRSSADGKSDGLPITIAGGDHADVPITPDNGKVLASLIIDEKLSMIIDLSLFRKGEQTKFVTDFAEELYHRNRSALHIVVDEADSFAPQRPMPDQNRMLGAMEDLVRRGRARGIGMTMITQRPSVLNKNVLTQIEVLVALRLTAPIDQKAIDEWVKTHAEEGQRDKFMTSLPSLPVGTAWFWSPGWLDIFQRVKVRKRETLDSSSTPKVGATKIEPRKMADVDLAAIRAKMSETIERVEAEDPKALRRKIIVLERELAEKSQKTTEKTVEIHILTDEQVDKFTAATHAMLGIGQEITEALRLYATPGTPQVKTVDIDHAKLGGDEGVTTYPGFISKDEYDKSGISDQYKKIKKEAEEGSTVMMFNERPSLRAGERRILETMARYNRFFSRTQLATVTKFSSRSGTFSTYLGSLKRAGLIIIDTGNRISLSQEGYNYVGEDIGAPPTTDELLDMWRGVLRAGERRMLDTLVDIYPKAISRAELGQRAEIDSDGGTFSTYLGSLKRNGLVSSAGGVIKASDNLFVLENQRA